MYIAYWTCATKMRFSSWSCGSVLPTLDLYYKVAISSWGRGSVFRVRHWHYKVAIFELELRKCSSRTRLALQRCDFRAGAAEVCFAYWSCATKLRFSTWSCGSILCVLDYKVAIFELELQKCASRARLALQRPNSTEIVQNPENRPKSTG